MVEHEILSLRKHGHWECVSADGDCPFRSANEETADQDLSGSSWTHLPPILPSCSSMILPTRIHHLSLVSSPTTLYYLDPSAKSSNSLPKTAGPVMVGTRDRSRNRGMDSRDQYELQDMQTSHRTGEGSTIDYENSHDDGDHGHPQNPGAQRLDRRIPGMCKERVAGALRTCKTQTVAVLRMCMVGLAKHRMMTLCIVSIIGFLVVWAFRVLKFSAKPPDYELEWSTEGATEHYLSTTTVRGSATLYRTITVQDVQFYGGRPVHHQAPITVAPNHERTGHVISRDSSYPLIGTGTSTSVSGLYYMPMSLTNEDWLQTQDSHLASNLVSNVGRETLI